MESSFIKDLKGIKKLVYDKLISHAPSRDNDVRLEANIWAKQLKDIGKDIMEMSAFEFIQMQISGNLTSSSSIRRARRKLNEQFPETRGNSYGNRKQEEELVTQQIHKV
jgi:hypothetical protein